MPNVLPLPYSTARLVDKVAPVDRHPGLQLDKFVMPVEAQKDQKESLEGVCATGGSPTLLTSLRARRAQTMRALSAVEWRCTTTGPLTLHLARASALENAGICLHPLYGFVYLPGSGLKGMARAYAETVWLPAQPDAAAAWGTIEGVFGWAPGSDRDKPWKPDVSPRRKGDEAQVGSVVFHDAWPESWPRLELDIVNNHHTEYYQADAGDQAHPPGDWESPVMVSFLAVGRGVTFRFAVSPRRGDAANESVALARQWLTGALVHSGAGAKTSAGYGGFRADEDTPDGRQQAEQVRQVWRGALQTPARKEFETTLRLVSPAFLAGARQEAADCDLRPATLRGLLRWWWRTMHAGFVDVATLRRLESLVWGDTAAGGAVRLQVEPTTKVSPILYDYKERFRPRPQFQRAHDLEVPPNGKTNQGLFYVSYGMDDGDRRRHYLPPGAAWTLRVTARPLVVNSRPINAEVVLQQAQASLVLLCRYGGVGSKSRKGFGSLSDAGPAGVTDDQCLQFAAMFRTLARCGGAFDERHARSPALVELQNMGPLEIATPWKDPWFALDQIGFSYQAFTQADPQTGHGKHCEGKAALGLPRRIHGPRNTPMDRQDRATHRRPVALRAPRGERHASPAFFHLAGDKGENLLIRMAAFPARELPDPQTSRRILAQLTEHLSRDLRQRVERYRDKGRRPTAFADDGSKTATACETPAHSLPKPGDRVSATLVAQKTNKGGWKAQLDETDLVGPVQNTQDVPAGHEVGQPLSLIVASIRPPAIAFRYPTPADEQRAAKAQNQGRSGGRRRRNQ